jgi:hypothetical protein
MLVAMMSLTEELAKAILLSPNQVNQSRSLMLSNCSASKARRSFALVFVTVPGVDPRTLTAAARADLAALFAAALFAASTSACLLAWTLSKRFGSKRKAF